MSFKGVQAKIAKTEGLGLDAAGAILASSSRNASPAAKKANPNLKKVKGEAKGKKGTFRSKGARDTSDKESPAEDKGENPKMDKGGY